VTFHANPDHGANPVVTPSSFYVRTDHNNPDPLAHRPDQLERRDGCPRLRDWLSIMLIVVNVLLEPIVLANRSPYNFKTLPR
jgi:hypothetical protein